MSPIETTDSMEHYEESENSSELGTTPKRPHLSPPTRNKFLNDHCTDENVMVQLNSTLNDIANRMEKWELKMKNMETSIKAFRAGSLSTLKSGKRKEKKQISSFLRVS